jgi:hypothetical protein
MTIRVLHCPTDTGRNAWTLAQAEKRLGLESTVLVYRSEWLNYPCDIDLDTRSLSKLGKLTTIGKLLLRAARDYDIIHFNAGRSLMKSSPGGIPWLSRADLAYFKMLGKGIVVTYQGCDVRQKTVCEDIFEINGCRYCTNPCSPELDAHKAYMVEGFDRYADAIFSLNPDLLNVLPSRAEFLPYTTIDPAEWTPVPLDPNKRAFTILHAPTNRGLKGTPFILEAVDTLKGSHPEVELLLVEKVPHDQVRAYYERADLVIDQLLLGWYGGFAVEAMALGRPVLAYIREEDLHFIPDEMRADIPVLNANPGDVAAVLERAITHRVELVDVGAKSRAYIEKWHDPLKIADRVKATYERILGRKARPA